MRRKPTVRSVVVWVCMLAIFDCSSSNGQGKGRILDWSKEGVVGVDLSPAEGSTLRVHVNPLLIDGVEDMAGEWTVPTSGVNKLLYGLPGRAIVMPPGAAGSGTLNVEVFPRDQRNAAELKNNLLLVLKSAPAYRALNVVLRLPKDDGGLSRLSIKGAEDVDTLLTKIPESGREMRLLAVENLVVVSIAPREAADLRVGIVSEHVESLARTIGQINDVDVVSAKPLVQEVVQKTDGLFHFLEQRILLNDPLTLYRAVWVTGYRNAFLKDPKVVRHVAPFNDNLKLAVVAQKKTCSVTVAMKDGSEADVKYKKSVDSSSSPLGKTVVVKEIERAYYTFSAFNGEDEEIGKTDQDCTGSTANVVIPLKDE